MSVLKMFEKSGDTHVGQTLTRLARLAQAAHEYESAMRQGRDGSCDATHEDDDEVALNRMRELLR